MSQGNAPASITEQTGSAETQPWPHYGGRITAVIAVRECILANAAETAAADELASVREWLSAMTGKTHSTGKLRKLQEIIADAMGIVRTGSGLENGLALLANPPNRTCFSTAPAFR